MLDEDSNSGTIVYRYRVLLVTIPYKHNGKIRWHCLTEVFKLSVMGHSDHQGIDIFGPDRNEVRVGSEGRPRWPHCLIVAAVCPTG